MAFHSATESRKLLLSFDDGPDLRGTPLILDELDRRGLKAIFFVTGWRLIGERPEDIARRDLVRKIAAHGHLVANHTMSHHDLCQNPAEQAAEIDANSELITETTGVRPFLFRSPYGAFCHSLEAALNARGLVDVGWNLDPQDWKTERDEEAVFSYLTNKLGGLKGRGILLMHDTHLASVHALPRLLDWLARAERARRAGGASADPDRRLPRDRPGARGRGRRPARAGWRAGRRRGRIRRAPPALIRPRGGPRRQTTHSRAAMFLLRDIAPADLDDLQKAAVHLDSVNLPDDRPALAAIIERSRASFAGELPVADRCFVFVAAQLLTATAPSGARWSGRR